ncbi:hypothetical protein [Actinophytocola xinjiangensis]|nr:hypothetical protein [Actinophytocola xinjiangensis]
MAGRVLIGLLIVFIAVLGVGGGVALITEGVDGRTAVADGPAGTLTPTGRQCGKESCSWIGTFTSDDRKTTRRDVELRDDQTVRRSDPTPAKIPDVRLHDGDPPVAYSTDYSPVPKIAGGVALIVVCLTVAVLLVLRVRRERKSRP